MKVEKEREEDEKKGQKGRRKGSGKVTSADTQAHVSCLLYSFVGRRLSVAEEHWGVLVSFSLHLSG